MKSFEERTEYLDKNLVFGPPMEWHALQPGTLRQHLAGGKAIGYDFDLHILSYRGIWLSTIEDVRLVVDGTEVDKHDMLFRLKDMSIHIDDVKNNTDVFWGTMDTATITVYCIGGLPKGEHTFEIEVYRRADFGHSFGEGTEGYETATEFNHPQVIRETVTYTMA